MRVNLCVLLPEVLLACKTFHIYNSPTLWEKYLSYPEADEKLNVTVIALLI